MSALRRMARTPSYWQGFTIVELLIVVVVIAILAAITIVTYNGITTRAKDTALRADLSTAAKQLSLYNIQNGTYPTSQVSDAGVKNSANADFAYTYNPGDNTYCLTASKGTLTYSIATNQTTPGQYACVSTLAGSPSGDAGYLDGQGVSARFDRPGFTTLGSDGMLYVSELASGGTRIRKINPTTAAVTTAFSSSSINIQSIFITSGGVIYADAISIASSTHYVAKIISGVLTEVTPSYSQTNFKYLWGIVLASDGYLYVGDDTPSCTLKKVNPSSGAITLVAGSEGSCGNATGTGTAARFSALEGMTLGPDGNLYINDVENNLIRKVTLSGVVTTFAGSGGAGYADGSVAQAQIYGPQAITADAAGTLYVLDGNGRVRMIKEGTVSTIANGTLFDSATGIATSVLSTGIVYVANFQGNRITKLQ